MIRFLKNCVPRSRNCLLDLLLKILILLAKGVNDVAVVYATLIIKGKKTFAQVPEKLKEQVREILTDLECPELAE